MRALCQTPGLSRSILQAACFVQQSSQRVVGYFEGWEVSDLVALWEAEERSRRKRCLGFYRNNEGQRMTVIVARDFPAAMCWNINPNQHGRSYIGTIGVGRIRKGKRGRVAIETAAGNDEFRFEFGSPIVTLPPPENLLAIAFGVGVVGTKPTPCATNRQHRPECFGAIPKPLSD